MLQRRGFAVGVVALAAAGAVLAPRAAQACGGCFHVPGEVNQVVTDHRMVVTIQPDYAVLWDQIQYTGNASDFAWVLPVWGDARVELASNEFFNELEQATAVRVQAPPVQFCGRAGGGGFGCGASAPSAGAFRAAGGDGTAGAPAEDPVQVLNMASVGPYQTVTLRSTDADALTAWLRTNRYAIPASIEPVIRWYTERHMDFVALRLRPDAGVQAMQPVRIRFSTANMVLPLRMVAAGVADKVGITLWAFGAGRYEAANFANAQIDPGELVWNWTTNRSNYREVFTATLNRTAAGRAWVTEFAGNVGAMAPRRSGTSRDDWNLAGGSAGSGDMTVTRMRTDLAINLLDADLLLQPARQSGSVSNSLRALRETGPNPGSACSEIATPADMARRPGSVLAGIAAGALALAVARRKARNRDRPAKG